MINLKIGGIILAAFIAGAFVASPELRAFAADTVGSADIINESILSEDIKNGEVKTADIGTDQVKAADIAADAVGSSEIATNAVSFLEIGLNAVGAEEIQNSAVGAGEISAGAVGSSELGIDLAFPGRTSYSPDTIVVASDGTVQSPLFGVNDVLHAFLEITCLDVHGCAITSTTTALDINAGVPGQILILSIGASSHPVQIVEQLNPPVGVTGVNLASGYRNLVNANDTLVLLFQDGEWTELNYKVNGSPP